MLDSSSCAEARSIYRMDHVTSYIEKKVWVHSSMVIGVSDGVCVVCGVTT
jgi:hypothetical protein